MNDLELQVVEQNAIAVAFQKENGIQDLFDRMAEQARSIVPDVSTKKGRDAIASQAYKVSKSKTAVDNHGKDLVAGIKAQAAVIDRDRKAWRDQCDALRDEIRKPLDEWEQAEKDRIALIENKINSLKQEFGSGFSDDIKRDIERIKSIEIDDSFMEFQDKAKLQKYETLELLESILAESLQREEQEAQQEKLRIAEQERLQQERDAQIAREAAEKATREAEEKARFEAERVEREKREAEQREARLKAEKEAALLREEQLKQQAIEQAKQAEIQKQQAIEAERLRIEAEQAARIKADQEAEAARLANKEHMRSINREILNKLCEIGLDEGQAKAVITAIANNQVPCVSVKY